jgi:hypothetical protein
MLAILAGRLRQLDCWNCIYTDKVTPLVPAAASGRVRHDEPWRR